MRYNTLFLAYLELRKDIFFQKIPLERRGYYLEEALRIGKEMANKIISSELDVVCRQLKVDVKRTMVSAKGHRGSLFMTNTKSEIILYQPTLLELSIKTGLTLQKIETVVVAHELFHLMEEQSVPTNQRLDKVCTVSCWRYRQWATVRKTREIAAHAFAGTYGQLSYLPNSWDYDWAELQRKDSQLYQAFQEFSYLCETKRVAMEEVV